MSAAFEAARQCFLAGLAAQQAGQLVQAETQYRQSLALLPGRASTLTNLGATLVQAGRPSEALPLLQQALQAEPGNGDAWAQHGLALVALQRDEEALQAFGQAVCTGQVTPATWYEQARCLARLGRLDAALASCEQALTLSPRVADGWALKGGLLKDMGRGSEAVPALHRAIALGGDAAMCGYLLASLQGGAAPPQPPPGYVQGLFDGYAAQFDEHLQRLHYRAPEVLVQGLPPRPQLWNSALDLGCGTGRCGVALRGLTQQLTGVDLSAGMLQQAQARGLYDTLQRADITAFLQASQQRFDLVIAADVFIYLGDLEAVFAAVFRALAPDGCFCFSVEAADDAVDFELRRSSRYAQSARYVQRLAQQHGLLIWQQQAQPLREDQRQPVAGLFYWLTPRRAY